MYVRHCPACRTDYRPEIATCADCGQTLVDRDDEEPIEDEGAPLAGEDLAAVPEGFEPIFSAGGVRDLRPLADRLVAEGIDFRLRDARQGCCVVGYRLLLHPDDRERARVCIGELAASVTVVAERHDPDDGQAPIYTHCPACETLLASDAWECPECGLPLGAPELSCPRCGQALEDESAPRCGNCGLSLEEG